MSAKAFPGDLDLLALHERHPDRYPILLESVSGAAALGRYDVLLALPGERLVQQPDGALTGDAPVTRNDGRFLDRLSGEKPQLDDLRLLRIDPGQLGQRAIERDEIDPAALSPIVHEQPFVERDLHVRAAALRRVPGARALDEQPPHRDRGERDEVRAVLPLRRSLLRQPQVGLVDEIARVHALGLFVADVAFGDASKLGVHLLDHLTGVGWRRHQSVSGRDSSSRCPR